eukprot:CAMPEP_0197641876 /NCGR_PEP_ID=MMETSP1338-20131121/15697_1 /TAXON_ID=43686 ORGANISM="Pelagodinium beii, Strain RCC1491" /NCGR_SAMPLE_ID=MMETSP1338 /ASSEMBLY_ACC=CAM_ASM_000754 /LENGTH=80 /DNA_ID=CAMNT_0043214917 /DNA_START=87 /DNA_END=329 /DNA_ORIENTATION=+
MSCAQVSSPSAEPSSVALKPSRKLWKSSCEAPAALAETSTSAMSLGRTSARTYFSALRPSIFAGFWSACRQRAQSVCTTL